MAADLAGHSWQATSRMVHKLGSEACHFGTHSTGSWLQNLISAHTGLHTSFTIICELTCQESGCCAACLVILVL